MSKKYSDNLLDRLNYNNKQMIKHYNSLIRSKRGELLVENALPTIAGIGALASFIAILHMTPENFLTEESYETIYNWAITSGCAEALFALGIPIIRHKAHKNIRDEITDLKFRRDYLAGKYHTCVCNEEDDLSQKPILGCEQVGNLTEAPQTLIRK